MTQQGRGEVQDGQYESSLARKQGLNWGTVTGIKLPCFQLLTAPSAPWVPSRRAIWSWWL